MNNKVNPQSENFENDFQEELARLEEHLAIAEAIKSRIDNLLLDHMWTISTNKNKTTPLSQNSEKSKWALLQETFVEFSKRSDVNGYVKIFEYENVFIKFIWFLILLGSLFITGYVLSWSVLAYLEYGVSSQIGLVYEMPTEFPAVTLCDANPFISKQSENVMNSIYTSKSLGDDFTTLNKLTTMLVSSPSYGDDNRKKLGFDINEFQLNCTFNNKDCRSELHWYWDYDYGNCYQFNVGQNQSNGKIETRKAFGKGPSYGLLINISIYTLMIILFFLEILESTQLLFGHLAGPVGTDDVNRHMSRLFSKLF
jgi:hypothetical protein